MPERRACIVMLLLALAWGSLLAVAIQQPGYTDAYYYFNAGQRLVDGDGLTDPYLWTYLNAPDELPGPSHTYWMPLESLMAAGSMALFGAHFGAAQVPSVLSFAGLVLIGYWLGARIGGTQRHAWLAGLLVLFSGFYTPFWTTTDTFALYGVVAALALIAMGRAREAGDERAYWFSGACVALAHLTRADGLLLLGVLILVAWWPGRAGAVRTATIGMIGAVLAYTAVMSPWFIRNWRETGALLPAGGMDTIWLRGYDELVNYPPGTSLADFFDWGLGNIIGSRLEALANNLGTFVAVETWIVLGPFALGGMWIRRRDPLVSGALWYAIGLHLVMTVVFAFPGYRGGLFHSSAALLPFWAVTGVIGLDATLHWAARRRRWHLQQAQGIFSVALIVLALVLSVWILESRRNAWNSAGIFYETLADDLPPDALVMCNDPPALYYHSGLGGVVVPNAPPELVPVIARQYGVTHLLLDTNHTAPFAALFRGDETRDFLRTLKVYGVDTAGRSDDRRLFEIVLQEHGP